MRISDWSSDVCSSDLKSELAYQAERVPATIAAARREALRTLSHSPAASHGLGTIHEPPTQATLGWARNSAALSSLMPPVGHSVRSASGPARPLSIARPPTALAGNSLHTRKPRAISAR